MINTLRLTHIIYLICLGWVGLHVSVYKDHLQAHLRIVFLQLLATYWDPAMFTNYASVHACYECIKLGGGTVGGTRIKIKRTVICFLNARNVLPSEVHHQICQVYGDNAMSDGMVRKWVGMVNEGRENVHDEARNGRPSLVNDDLVRKVNERVRDDGRFTISDLSLHFPQISRTLWHCQ